MYQLYKPLRNYLRQQSLIESLITVHAWIQHLQSGIDLPTRLTHPQMRYTKDRYRLGISEWELDTLCREIVLNSPLRAASAISDWASLAKAINGIKLIEEEVWGELGDAEKILLELHRLSHRQFPWQNPMTQPDFIRYFKIFKTPELDALVTANTGLPTVDLFPIALSISGHLLRGPFVAYPLNNDLNSIPNDVLNTFIERFSLSFSELQARTKAAQQYDINWAYSSNPLRDRPLFQMQVNGALNYMCPIPPFLMRRLTDGIYYELVGSPGFSKAFGSAFQKYVGEVVEAVRMRKATLTSLPECEYRISSNRKDTIDWIVEDSSASLFVECKAKRMIVQAKIDLNSTEALDKELKTLSSFICQAYRTLSDALGGHYPHWKFRDLPIYPVIVTLDDWYVFGPATLGKVDKFVRETLEAEGVELSLLDKYPYTLCAVHEFEVGTQVMAFRSINEVMRKKTSGEAHTWSLGPHLRSEFRDDIKQHVDMLFRDDWRFMRPRI